MNRGLLFLSLLPLTPAIFAQTIGQKDCTPLDVRKTHPKISKSPELIKHFSTPRNQDSIGWCYAFSSSDLLSAHLGTPVSSFHTSTIYNRTLFLSPKERKIADAKLKKGMRRFDEVYQAGASSTAIQYVSANGWVCSEKGLPYDTEKPENMPLMIRKLEDLKYNNKDRLAYNWKQVCDDLMKIIEPFKLLASDSERIASYMIGSNMNVTLDDFSTSACKEKITRLPKMEVVYELKMKDATTPTPNYFKLLNDAISRGKLVQFDYEASDVSFATGTHSSVIIGRRWKNNRCEYNVRNSWGKGCSVYLDGIECNKTEGSYWISDAKLYSTSTSFNYIK